MAATDLGLIGAILSDGTILQDLFSEDAPKRQFLLFTE